MNLFFAPTMVIAVCLLFLAGSLAVEETITPPADPLLIDFENFPQARTFFGGDPCANMLYQIFNITDAKCSVQCFIQAGQQQGGYCDNNACQCNVVT